MIKVRVCWQTPVQKGYLSEGFDWLMKMGEHGLHADDVVLQRSNIFSQICTRNIDGFWN